ncbi:MAG: winged helix-turn-helix domain-containing protein [Deltaproteobacteria bacterium]|jgi:hypothetical protein|nr:winged helix-turn-helix domain-containing protein [Deltaproteobacteria bacterium]
MPLPPVDIFYPAVLEFSFTFRTVSVDSLRGPVGRRLKILDGQPDAPAPSGNETGIDYSIRRALDDLERAGLMARTDFRTFEITEKGMGLFPSITYERPLAVILNEIMAGKAGGNPRTASPRPEERRFPAGPAARDHSGPLSAAGCRLPALAALARLGHASCTDIRTESLNMLTAQAAASGIRHFDPDSPDLLVKIRQAVTSLISSGRAERVSRGIYKITPFGLETLTRHFPDFEGAAGPRRAAPAPPARNLASPNDAAKLREALGRWAAALGPKMKEGLAAAVSRREADYDGLKNGAPSDAARASRHEAGASQDMSSIVRLHEEAMAATTEARAIRAQIDAENARLMDPIAFGTGPFRSGSPLPRDHYSAVADAVREYEADVIGTLKRLILELDPESFARLAEAAAPGIWEGMDPGGAPAPSEVRAVTESEARDGLDWLRIFAMDMLSRSAGPWALFISGELPPEAAEIVARLPGHAKVADASRMAALMYRYGVGVRTVGVLAAKEADPKVFGWR